MGLVCSQCTNPKGPEQKRPNIIIIYTDDQGYGDLGCYGATDIQTPNIDQLAREGIRLTSFYVAQPVCTASRVSLLTGCYPNRLGMHGALMPGVGKGIHSEEQTLAELLKGHGYSTAIFGKWHLGSEEAFHPLNHGFDEYFGIPYSNDMWPLHPWQGSIFNFPELPLYDGKEVIDTLTDQRHLTTDLTNRALDFIQRSADNPFFLYLPHPQPHVPLFAGDSFLGTSKAGLYGDVISEIDRSTGQILDLLERLGLTENTVFIYASDNGPWLAYGAHAGKTGGFREGKGTIWEGGVRVPCIIRYPAQFMANAEVHTPIMSIDLLPTICQLTGAPLPEKKIDGLDVSRILAGQITESPHEAYYFYYRQNELQALRAGDYKLILPHIFNSLNGRNGGREGIPATYTQITIEGTELYNLREDPGEHENLADDYPSIVDSLMIFAGAIRSELGDTRIGKNGTGSRKPGLIQSAQ